MFNDISFTIVLISIFTLVTVGLARLLAGKEKKVDAWRYAVFGIVVIVALMASWLAAQVLVTASVVAGALIVLAGLKWVIGLTWKKTFIGTVAWIVLWYVVNLIVILLVSITSTSP